MTTVIYTPEAVSWHLKDTYRSPSSSRHLNRHYLNQGSAVTEMKVRNTVFPPWSEKCLR